MDTGLQQEFRNVLRNPVFYQHPTRKQLEIVNSFLQRGLSQDRVNQLMDDVKLEEQQGKFSISGSNVSGPVFPSNNIDLFRQLTDYIKFNANLDARALNDYRAKLGWPIDNFNSALAKATPRIHGLFPQLFNFRDGNMMVLFLSFEIKNEIADIVYQNERDIYDGKVQNSIQNQNALINWLISVGLVDQQAREIVTRISDMIIKLILVGESKKQITIQPPKQENSHIPSTSTPGNVDERTFNLIVGLFTEDKNKLLRSDVIQYLNNVRKSFGLTIDQFNNVIKNGWISAGRGNDTAPFIEKDQRGEVKFVKEFLDEIGIDQLRTVEKASTKLTTKKVTKPQTTGKNQNKTIRSVAQDNYIDLHYALDRLDEFINDNLRTIRNKEVAKFGRNGLLIGDIHKLIEDVADYAEMIDDILHSGQYLPLPVEVFDDMMDLWKIRLIEIIDNQEKLGKRCINKETPILGTPVDELTEGEYTRLSNEICWENEELMEYIIARGGKNDASNLKTYPSKKIWENDGDFSLILAIPQGRKNGFSKWLKEITSTGLANRISDLTLDRMYVCSSVLTSKGRAFRDIARRELAQDPKLMAIWQKIHENADNIPRIKNRELRDELSRAVTLALKSTSIAEFRGYYKGLNEDERDALKTFDPHLEGLIESCYEGHECVFGVSNTLIALRNQIARLKKVSIVDLDND